MQTYPLLSTQERMWFEWKLNPYCLAYNTVFLFKVEGICKPAILEASLLYLIKRHESLRTSYIEKNAVPYQVLHPDHSLQLHTYNINHLLDEAKSVEYQRLIDEHFLIPFNLTQSPPHRYIYISLKEHLSVFGCSWHHIMIDAWSVEIFLKELSTIYNALQMGQEVLFDYSPPSIKELVDFDRRQDRQIGITYWKEKLAFTDFTVDLPKNGPLALQKRNGKRIRYSLDSTITQKLMQVVSLTESTLFIVLLSALQALLYCYTKQQDFAIGYSVNLRQRLHKNALGFFVNNLPMAVQIRENTTFLDLVANLLRNRQFEATPLNEIIQGMRELRDVPHHSLFNIQVNQSSYLSFKLNLNESTSHPIGLTDIDAENELTIRFDHFDHIELELDFQTQCFNLQFIENLVKNYERILHTIVEHPSINIYQELCLLDEKEKRAILEQSVCQDIIETQNTIHGLFEQQVCQTPLIAAITRNGQSLSYTQLNQQANQLAYYLRAQGIQEDTMVALCLPPSKEMLIGILGILKAGGAYVPIDPTLPKERIDFILKDTQAKIILNQQKIIDLLLDPVFLKTQPTSNLTTKSHPQNLAYVIYTSGSTGTPKGVMIEHQSCVNYLNWCKTNYPLAEGNTIPLISSYAFDMSITSLFLPLISGKTLDLNDDLLTGSFSNHCFVKMTPSHIKMLSSDNKSDHPITFVIGGEELTWADVKTLRKQYPQAIIYNEYGPTEATVGCAVYRIGQETHASIPIGKPIANTELYILDERLNPVAIGCIGELYIGGIGLARGYLNQPILSQEKFIPHPFNHTLNNRLYKTGDLARFTLEGEVEFLGRKDSQIKIRGFRVELKEIESCLKRHGDVKEAIVIKTKDEQLVAYFISEEFCPSQEELSAFLKRTLPAYMIPSAFIRLQSLPLTANGKLDFRALPPLDVQADHLSSEALPQTEIEKGIAKIWAQLLNKRSLSRHDNFFKIGGHSLLATQCAFQLRACFQVEISLRNLFEFPTIVTLAEFIDHQPKSNPIDIPKIRRESVVS